MKNRVREILNGERPGERRPLDAFWNKESEGMRGKKSVCRSFKKEICAKKTHPKVGKEADGERKKGQRERKKDILNDNTSVVLFFFRGLRWWIPGYSDGRDRSGGWPSILLPRLA